MPFIFISYSHKDSEYANRLADSLEAKGLEVWIDDRIDYGDTWPDVIEEQVDGCSALIVVMTPGSHKSKWVKNELSCAQRKGKPVFPLLLEGDPWLSVEATQYVDVLDGSLPPERFYSGVAAIMSAKEADIPQPPGQKDASSSAEVAQDGSKPRPPLCNSTVTAMTNATANGAHGKRHWAEEPCASFDARTARKWRRGGHPPRQPSPGGIHGYITPAAT